MMMRDFRLAAVALVAVLALGAAAAERETHARALSARPLLERRAASELRTLCALRGGLGRRGRAVAPPPSEPAKGNMVQRALEPLKAMLQRGISPRVLAASLALGGACGVFPVPLTTWAVTLAANALVPSLNPLAMQLANSVVTPLMVPLFPVFLQVAALIRGPAAASFRFGDIRAQFQKVRAAEAEEGCRHLRARTRHCG
jgi:hypothetical protein